MPPPTAGADSGHVSPKPCTVVSVQIAARKLAIAMLAMTVSLTVAYIVTGTLSSVVMPGHPLYGLPRFFDMAQEANLPAYYSALCLLLTAVVLAVLARAERAAAWRSYWIGLVAGFLYLSVDEAAQIHDAILGPGFASAVGKSSLPFFYHTWVMPAIGAVAIVAILYARFLLALPRRHARRFLLAGVVYVSATVGGDLIEGYLATNTASQLALIIQNSIEESGELLGITAFLYALLGYAAEQGVTLSVGTSSTNG
ncbi:MAG: hypothetical protein AB7F99_15630 [Vicinamibacterales bacterium]